LIVKINKKIIFSNMSAEALAMLENFSLPGDFCIDIRQARYIFQEAGVHNPWVPPSRTGSYFQTGKEWTVETYDLEWVKGSSAGGGRRYSNI